MSINQQKQQQNEMIQELKREAEEWKRSYSQIMDKHRQAEEWEMQAKAYARMTTELNEQKSQLVSQHEELKIKLNQIEPQIAKYHELETQL